MNNTQSCKALPLVHGSASGPLLSSNLELSFWGGVDPNSGEIIDRHHPLSGKSVGGAILAIPGGRGSCSGSGVLLELLLNGKGPRALVFSRPDDILTLGVVVAKELFGREIPVVVLEGEDFGEVSKAEFARVDGGALFWGQSELPADRKIGSHSKSPVVSDWTQSFRLSDLDKAYLDGHHGQAGAAAMRIILEMSRLQGAKELIDVTQVHIDGCVYTGPGSLAFAEKLRDMGGKVLVRTTLNSVSVDQRRWRSQGVECAFGTAAEKLATAYVDMGARPTFTCAPYLLDSAPKRGEQIAWAESNAVVYANSVLGAKTMKYPDFLDIAIALTGRAPYGGLHIAENRSATICFDLNKYMPSANRRGDLFYPVLGYTVGRLSGSQIPAIVGLDSANPSKDDLKAFGAAFATVSSAPMFHMVGVTPEAPSLAAALCKKTSQVQTIHLLPEQLHASLASLNSPGPIQKVDLVSLGNPHFSLPEIRKLASLCKGRKKALTVAVVVTCGRSTFGLASQAGLVADLEAFGVQFVEDTCWCMIGEPVIPSRAEVIMTNSAKYAHYGPGLTGRRFRFGGLGECVDAACGGLHERTGVVL